MEAIGGFRDAISIAAIVHNRTNAIIHGNAKTNQYSSFFDSMPGCSAKTSIYSPPAILPHQAQA